MIKDGLFSEEKPLLNRPTVGIIFAFCAIAVAIPSWFLGMFFNHYFCGEGAFLDSFVAWFLK